MKKFRNKIMKMAKEAGFRSFRAVAIAAGANVRVSFEIINGQKSVVGKNGRVSTDADKIAKVLGETPGTLFGVVEEFELPVKRHKRCISGEMRILINKSHLSPIQKDILKRIFLRGESTRRIANDYGISISAVNLILKKARNKISKRYELARWLGLV